MKNNISAKKTFNKRPFIAALLFICSLVISSGWNSAHAAGAVSLIVSSMSQQVIPHTSSGSTHVFSNYVVPAGTERLLVVAAATSIEADIWEKATYGSTEMSYATAHHDSFGTGVSIWVLPLGTSTTAESPQTITLSHFSGSTLFTDAEFVAVAVFENVDQADPVAPAAPNPTPPGARRFGIADDGYPNVANATLTVPSDTGDLIFSLYAAYNDGGNGHPANNVASGQTKRHTATATSDPGPCATCYHADFRWTTSTKPGTAGTDTVNYTDTPLAWVHGAVNLNQSTNLPPSITSSNSASVDENQTIAIDVAASDDGDSEGSGLTYSLTGGDDVNLFNIDGSSGVVTFKNAPDYEMPGDTDDGNDYEIRVTVTDSGGLTAVQSITINVDDIFECPVFPSTVSSEAELNFAIACYNDATSGSHAFTLTQTITLTANTTAVNNSTSASLQINGASYMLNGAGSYRLFEIQDGNVTMTNLVLYDGFGSALSCSGQFFACGGALFVGPAAIVTLTDVMVLNSEAELGGGISVDSGELTINSSTLHGNTATAGGGALDNFAGTVTINNSTISGNSAVGVGGGLLLSSGTTTITNSTIADNTAPEGSGIDHFVSNTILYNTIVADNIGSANCDINDNSSFAANATNLASDNSCDNAVVSATVNLGPLQDNGGATWTHALLPRSAAIDAGDNAICAAAPINNLDQLGVARPQGPACDIGAFEIEEVTLTQQPTLELSAAGAFSWKPEVPISCIVSLSSSTDPYGTYNWLEDAPFSNATSLADADINNFYSLDVDCGTTKVSSENQVGEFTFEIVAGS